LAEDAALPVAPHPDGFRGATFARMCRSDQEVDAVMARALGIGARLLKPAQKTSFGGYSGYFADPDGHAWEVAHNPGWPLGDDGLPQLP